MRDKDINQIIIAAIVNLCLIVWLIRYAWSGNDKAIIMVIFLYPFLTLVNGVFWMFSESKAFKVTTLGLLILFFPVLMIAASR